MDLELYLNLRMKNLQELLGIYSKVLVNLFRIGGRLKRNIKCILIKLVLKWKKMIVYAFKYSPDYESGYYVVSLHKTQKSAEIAMEFHKVEKLRENEEYLEEIRKEAPEYNNDLEEYSKWCVVKCEILD